MTCVSRNPFKQPPTHQDQLRNPLFLYTHTHTHTIFVFLGHKNRWEAQEREKKAKEMVGEGMGGGLKASEKKGEGMT